MENAATNEQLGVRNAILELPETEKHQGLDIHYVEIVRHPAGADAKIRDWIEKRAYFEKIYTENVEEEQQIMISWPTIG